MGTFYGSSATPVWFGRVWDPRRGWSTVKYQRGTPADMLVAFNAARAAGYRVREDPDPEGGFTTISIEIGNDDNHPLDEPLTDEWSLVGNDLEKSIFNHSKVEVLRAGGGQTNQAWDSTKSAAFRKACEEVASGSTTDDIETVLFEKYSAWSQNEIDTAGEIVNELARGTEAFTVSQFVLKRTTIVPQRTDLKKSVEGAGLVYTTEQLQSAESVVPETLKFILPAGFWLKRTPTVTQEGRDKWRFEQEWWHADDYSEFLYDRAT